MSARVMILAPSSDLDRDRRRQLAAALLTEGFETTQLDTPESLTKLPYALVRSMRVRRGTLPACVVTSGGRPAEHAVGVSLHRRGVPWIADVDSAWEFNVGGRWRRQLSPSMRLLRGPDVVLAGEAGEAKRLHDAYGCNSVALGALDGESCQRLAGYVRTLTSTPGPGRLRILMLGPINTPHVEHLALAMRDEGHQVVVGGEPTSAYPRSPLIDDGIRVSTMTFPATSWLRGLVRTFKPDVIHAHWLPAFGFLAALTKSRPLVAMAWGSDVLQSGRWGLRACRYTLRHADVAMGDSLAILGRLVELGADPDRTYLLNWGVDLERFSPPTDRAAIRRRLGLADAPTILSPRALSELYNPRTILEAHARLAARIPGLQLVLKHIGRDAPNLGKLGPGVRIVGHVAYERMADYYRAADVCVSIPSSDSSPRSVWEAMACGSPCVLSDLPWVHELIEADVHALVTQIDAGAVAVAIARLLEDVVLRDRIGRAGRRLVAEHRNRDQEIERLAQVYSKLARGGANGAGG